MVCPYLLCSWSVWCTHDLCFLHSSSCLPVALKETSQSLSPYTLQTNINPSLYCGVSLRSDIHFSCSTWSKCACPLDTEKSRRGILALTFCFSSAVLLYEHLSFSWGKGWQTNTLTPASKDHTLGFLRVIAVNNLLQGVQICFPALLRQQPKNSNQLVIMSIRIISNLRAAALNISQKLIFLPLNSIENLLSLCSFTVGRSDYFFHHSKQDPGLSAVAVWLFQQQWMG